MNTTKYILSLTELKIIIQGVIRRIKLNHIAVCLLDLNGWHICSTGLMLQCPSTTLVPLVLLTLFHCCFMDPSVTVVLCPLGTLITSEQSVNSPVATSNRQRDECFHNVAEIYPGLILTLAHLRLLHLCCEGKCHLKGFTEVLTLLFLLNIHTTLNTF